MVKSTLKNPYSEKFLLGNKTDTLACSKNKTPKLCAIYFIGITIGINEIYLRALEGSTK